MARAIFSINYIVRIYRWTKNKPSILVGVVEEVGVNGRKAFTNYDELWEILNTLDSCPSSPRIESIRVKGKRFREEKSAKV